MGHAQRFRQDAPNGRKRERLLDLAPARTDVGHPDGSVAHWDRLDFVPPNDREPFLPVVETAPQRRLNRTEIRFLSRDRNDRSIHRRMDGVDSDDVEAADRGPVDQDGGESRAEAPSNQRPPRAPSAGASTELSLEATGVPGGLRL